MASIPVNGGFPRAPTSTTQLQKIGDEQYSQELQFIYEGDSLHGIAAAYYLAFAQLAHAEHELAEMGLSRRSSATINVKITHRHLRTLLACCSTNCSVRVMTSLHSSATLPAASSSAHCPLRAPCSCLGQSRG